ncbi:FAD-dependent oxidoreductase [Saprospiraceae bacterium]|jgi:oxygen-dependent protoporphyrinogen oxidase|nr:FAD-dependent oxidoreductase [Saprospiraceae bacterium]
MKYQIPNSNFLGKPFDQKQTYTIVGAGISGLLLGYQLKKVKVPFKIVEQNDFGGGILQSVQTDLGLIEKAANGFIWCKEIQSICDDLKLEILSPKSTSKARYMVKNKKLRRIPLSFFDAIRLIRTFTKKQSGIFETLEDFGHYFLGEKLTAQVLEPAFQGIYGAPADQLSFPGAITPLANAFNEVNYLRPAFKKMRSTSTVSERKKKSEGTHGFKNGMGEFTQRLSEYLYNDIEWNIDGLTLKDEKENLILTTPAYISKHFFKTKDEKMFQQLDLVKYNSMISATLFFQKSALKKFKEGFGCLIPQKEGLNILGVLFNSCIFDFRVKNDDLVSLTCLLRDDSLNKKWFVQNDTFLKSMIISDLSELFEVREAPLDMFVTKWENGIPLYSPNLYQSWFSMDELLKNQYSNRNLFGNYTGEISVRALAQSSHAIIMK